MTQTAINYAKVLYELGIDKTIIEETEEAFKKVPKLRTSLMSPIIPIQVKHSIIEKVFQKEIKKFPENFMRLP